MFKMGLRKIGTLFCVLLLGAGLVAAQTDTTELEFEEFAPLFFELTEVGIAEDWEYQVDEDNERVILDSVADDIQIQFYDSLEQDDFFSIDLEMSADEALVAFYSDLYDLDVDIDDIDVTEAEDETSETAILEFTPDNITYLVNHTEFETVFAADAYNTTGDPLTDEQLEIIEQVLMSVRPLDTADAEETEASTASTEPCVITVEEDNTVPLRVGPGENRSIIAFIDAGEYTPEGQTTVNDSQWFKLDKDEAAPNSSANETWLAADDVSTDGDCDAVDDTAAPAVIPIVVTMPPPAADGDSSDDASSDEVTDGAITLQSGTYTLSFGGVSGSCASDEYIFEATTPAELGLTTESVFVSPAVNSVNIDGDVLTLRADGQYFGTYNFPEDGTNGQVYLRAISPTSLQGSIVTNFTLDDGVNCSATVVMNITQ